MTKVQEKKDKRRDILITSEYVHSLWPSLNCIAGALAIIKMKKRKLETEVYYAVYNLICVSYAIVLSQYF